MVFQEYMIVQLIFFVFVAMFIGNEIKKTQLLPNSKDRKLIYTTLFFIFIGIVVRLINLSHPIGVFVDEAMGAYDSWSLAHYGVDSNLNSYPIYLRSWGSGQSAVYAYLALPFIKLFGLNAEAYRLPMSILGCSSVLFFYWTLRKTQNNILLIACCAIFFAINPWHIMKSRFGLDCNICPDFLLIAVCFILLAIYTKHNRFFLLILGFISLCISAYSYGISWFMLPIFYSSLLIFLYKKDIISIKNSLFIISISAIILLPLILFAFVLFFQLEAFQLGPLTIPQLTASRHSTTTIFGSTNLKETIIWYLINIKKMLLVGSDLMNTSTLPFWGIFYQLLSWPFFVYGIYRSILKRNELNSIFLIWLVSSLPIVFTVEPNITHWNIVWIPLIFFIGYGIYALILKFPKSTLYIAGIYTLAFFSFIGIYFKPNAYNPFNSYIFEKESKFAQSHSFKTVYYPKNITHCYTLFYNPISPYKYANTFISNGKSLAWALAYDNIQFGLPEKITPQTSTAYVLPNTLLENIDLTEFKIEKGIHYSVIWND